MPKPPLLRAFDVWLAKANHTLAIPLAVTERSSKSTLLHLDGITKAIEVWVHVSGLTIAVMHNNTCWDWIYDLDCAARRIRGGIVCSFCEFDKRQIFATHNDLYEDHIFQPLRDWINAKLAPAKYLGIGGGDGATWATLLTADDLKGYETLIRLRSERAS